MEKRKRKRKLKRIFGVLALSVLMSFCLAPTAFALSDDAAGGDAVANETEKSSAAQIEETAAEADTTAPNHVDTAAPSDEKKGTDISYNASAVFWGTEFPVADGSAAITAEDAREGKTLGEVSEDFKGTKLEDYNAGNLVMKGDLAIRNQDGSASDTTNKAPHEVKKDTKYDLEADLNVEAVHDAIEKSAVLMSAVYNADAVKVVYVNNLETGLRSTFTFGSDLNGEFYVPTSLEDAQKHYVLSSADGNPLIYRINYAKSKFAKDNVSIVMDLDLTQMDAHKTTYDGSGKTLYGIGGVMENFNHSGKEYGDTYDTSTFGNLRQLITSSAKKIHLQIKDVLLHSASGNSNTTETSTEVTRTSQGTIHGTLVGYMKADAGHGHIKGHISYVWGAMQDTEGKVVNKGADDDSIAVTAQFTEITKKDIPVQPDKPDQPSKPGSQTVHNNTNRSASDAAVKKTSANPNTGDANSLPVWIVLLMASAGVCGASVIYRRKQNNN
ncbi:MAG: cell surface protein [Eubacteriales bacterium]|nr:cell surface protein [Eubacteriales bacterium]